MEFSLDSLQPKERASFALRALYEAAGCRKYHMGRFEEYGLYQENRSFLSSEQVITFTDVILLYLDKVVKRESDRVFIFMIRFFCAFVQKGEMISLIEA